jgi:hypothetical protein
MCRFCFRLLLGCSCFLVRACEGGTTLALTYTTLALTYTTLALTYTTLALTYTTLVDIRPLWSTTFALVH